MVVVVVVEVVVAVVGVEVGVEVIVAAAIVVVVVDILLLMPPYYVVLRWCMVSMWCCSSSLRAVGSPRLGAGSVKGLQPHKRKPKGPDNSAPPPNTLNHTFKLQPLNPKTFRTPTDLKALTVNFIPETLSPKLYALNSNKA